MGRSNAQIFAVAICTAVLSVSAGGCMPVLIEDGEHHDGLHFDYAPSTITDYIYDAGVWEPDERWSYDYDEEGRLELRTLYEYEDGSWQALLRNSYEYDGGRLATITTFWFWDSDEEWSQSRRLIYDYGGTGMLEAITTLSYDAYEERWHEEELERYEYERGRLAHSEDYYFENGEWSQTSTADYIYDSSGRLEETSSHSVSGDDDWSFRRSFQYDLEGRLERSFISYANEGSDIEPTGRETYALGEGTALEEMTTEFFDAGDWAPEERTVNAFDDDGRVAEIIGFNYEAGGWTDDDRRVVEFTDDGTSDTFIQEDPSPIAGWVTYRYGHVLANLYGE